MEAKTKVAIKFWLRLIGGYSLFFLVVFAFGFIMEKLLETLFIVIGYFSTRFAVPKIKHFDTTQKCISVSTMTFLFAIAILCIPHNKSLVWSIIIGAIIPMIMYAESLLFDVKISDEDKLISLCKLHGYNELKTQIAVKFFIDKEKVKDVWLWLCNEQNYNIEYDSVKKIKLRMKKDLFS